MSASDAFEKYVREGAETKKAVPYKCPKCCSEVGNYYGRLVFPEEELPVFCPNHDALVRLFPVVVGAGGRVHRYLKPNALVE